VFDFVNPLRPCRDRLSQTWEAGRSRGRGLVRNSMAYRLRINLDRARGALAFIGADSRIPLSCWYT
jgi:hypothetical protein